MNDAVLLIADLVAVTALTYGSYYRKHRRRDMVLAYMGLNVGVLAVSTVLTGSGVGLGLGLGLFGVLSIIRLRSTEISQEEVAYYFAALALGLIFGLAPEPLWLAPALGALLVGVVVLVDHQPRAAGSRRQLVTLDRVISDEAALAAHLATVLGGTGRPVVVHRVVVQGTDLVRDAMTVDVRYQVAATPRRRTTGGERLVARDADGRQVRDADVPSGPRDVPADALSWR